MFPSRKYEIRPSKLVFTYGPGSIADFPNRESFMVMAPEFWPDHRKIFERRLALKLRVNHFGEPLEVWDKSTDSLKGLPVRDFPYIRFCPSCKELTRDRICRRCAKPRATGKSGSSPDASREDAAGSSSGKTLAPRLVAACVAGHIEDFPWKTWCRCTCKVGTEELYLEGEAADNENSDLLVICKKCGRKRNLSGALEELSEPGCHGKRPWINDSERCDYPLRGLMRGASNVYFPIPDSSLSIPPFSKKIHSIVRPHLVPARLNWERGRIPVYIEGNEELQTYIRASVYSREDFETAFDELLGERPQRGIKTEEWEALTGDAPSPPTDDFRKNNVVLDAYLEGLFEQVAAVTKLREVTCLRGLTRIEPWSGSESVIAQPVGKRLVGALPDPMHTSPPAREPDEEGDESRWLPGCELFGEGIFFWIREERVDGWLSREGAKERVAAVRKSHSLPRPREGVDLNDDRLTFVHTLSHLMIRQISMSCGYSSASLRERLYVGSEEGIDKCGVLIYTASPDSEGTLGGLVGQAKTAELLSEHVQLALRGAKVCSQDPLCNAHDPVRTGNAWGASCHACTQLPETSCEALQNKLLDRIALL